MIAPPENKNSSVLPLEIFDHIFSYLQNDPDTLRSIDDVCQETSFPRGILDRHLYAHIVVTNFISTRPDSFSYYQLFQYLTSNPHVSKYIRTLQIEIEMSSPVQWHNHMSSILRMLQSTLKGLSLSNRSSPSLSSAEPSATMLKWSDLHETFRKAFLVCLRSSSLTDASINCISGLPLAIFNDCTMQNITLRQVEVFSSPLPQFPLQAASLRIDQVSYKSIIDIRDWVQEGCNLQSLSFSSDHKLSFAYFLNELYAELLSDLCLNFGTLFMWPYPPRHIKLKMNQPLYLSISHLPNLTKLTIWASISYHLWINSAIPSIAQVAATSPSLRRLILRIKFDPKRVSGIADPRIWEPLVSLAGHPSLEHVELGVIPEGQHTPDLTSKLLGVPQLKEMYEEGFLSLKQIDE